MGSAFGKTLEDATSITQPLRWKGRWFSPVAGGLYDVRARQWSPELGVFLSVDEYRYHDSKSTLWGWPNQNPARYADPSGRQRVEPKELGPLGPYDDPYPPDFPQCVVGVEIDPICFVACIASTNVHSSPPGSIVSSLLASGCDCSNIYLWRPVYGPCGPPPPPLSCDSLFICNPDPACRAAPDPPYSPRGPISSGD